MLRTAIENLIEGKDFSFEEAQALFSEMLRFENPPQIAAILALLRAKGESVDELHGFAAAMQTMMRPVQAHSSVLDIVGTGGDGMHTLNISTASALLAASMGVKIAKHGNRSVSSLSGSADVLEALGISIVQTPEKVAESIASIGIGFMFAPEFHPALKTFKEIRKELKIRTLFNLLGPLLNPARPKHVMLGVFDENLMETLASVLQKMGTTRSFVFHGNGLDEISCVGPTRVIEVNGDEMRTFMLDPTEYGFKKCSLEDLKGKDAAYNAEQLLLMLGGEESAFADTVALNAGIAAYLYGTVKSIEEGVRFAQDNLKNKKALDLLEQWKRTT